MPSIDFYHFPASGPCRKVLLTARNLGLNINIKLIDVWKKEQLTKEFIELNPEHCVPTINDNGFVLWESRVIGTYLVDSKSPNHALYPVDPKRRAIIDQRIAFDALILHPRMREVFSNVIYTGETTISNEVRKNLLDAYSQLDGYLKNQNWIAGSDTVTLADLYILATISSAMSCGASIDNYKNIAAWYERCKLLPGFQENEEGSKVYGARVKSILTDKF